MPIVPTGYVVAVCKLVIGNRDGERGGQALAEVAASLEVPRGAISHATDPSTLVVLWPAESVAHVEAAGNFVTQLQDEAVKRSGTARARVRAGIGGFYPRPRRPPRPFFPTHPAGQAGPEAPPPGGGP